MPNNDGPTLGALTDVRSVIAALDEYDRIGPKAFFDNYSYLDNAGKSHRFSKSTKYPLYYRNSKDPTAPYPSKAIVAAAHWHQHRGEPLAFFSGGLKTVVAKLESLDPNHEYFSVNQPYLDSIPDTYISSGSDFERLLIFIHDEMLMRAVYQPVMLRELLQNGPSGTPTIARAIWTEDSGRMGGPSTYEGIVRDQPGPVLSRHGWISYDDAADEYSLKYGSDFTREQQRILLKTCDDRITEYLDDRVGQTLISRGQANDLNFRRRFNSHLNHLTDTDGPAGQASYRKEQAALRALLFEDSTEFQCAFCLKVIPVELMVAAHIKPRSKCTESERVDPAVVMPMCRIGCDALYEINYLTVDDLGTIKRTECSSVADDLTVVLNGLEGNVCPYFNDTTKDYFSYKRQTKVVP